MICADLPLSVTYGRWDVLREARVLIQPLSFETFLFVISGLLKFAS
jgi:hypothetical protein